jgi:two-component system chemotaxis response regulator CheB
MSKIRVMVVDDAVVFRRLVSEELNRDPELEVVGTAPNGRIALAKVPQVNPDVIVLDIEMPEMDGLQTLTELRKTYARLPVIMFSALTERGAAATLDALALGATDYFAKPSNLNVDDSLAVVRQQLVPQVKVLGRRYLTREARDVEVRHTPPPPKAAVPSAPAAPPAPKGLVRIVALGASTGGPNAYLELFAKLPKNFPVPIVLVQHMPPMFTRLLAERLSAHGPLTVQEGASGMLLQPGHVYIAPGDFHMMVVKDGSKGRLLVHQDPPENSCRPAVDVLFRSVARTFGSHSLSVILTGMGQDGLRGCEALREAGAPIIAQDQDSSVVWGMPGFVVKAGLADQVLPLKEIAPEILRRVR